MLRYSIHTVWIHVSDSVFPLEKRTVAFSNRLSPIEAIYHMYQVLVELTAQNQPLTLLQFLYTKVIFLTSWSMNHEAACCTSMILVATPLHKISLKETSTWSLIIPVFKY